MNVFCKYWITLGILQVRTDSSADTVLEKVHNLFTVENTTVYTVSWVGVQGSGEKREGNPHTQPLFLHSHSLLFGHSRSNFTHAATHRNLGRGSQTGPRNVCFRHKKTQNKYP